MACREIFIKFGCFSSERTIPQYQLSSAVTNCQHLATFLAIYFLSGDHIQFNILLTGMCDSCSSYSNLLGLHSLALTDILLSISLFTVYFLRRLLFGFLGMLL